MTLKYSFTKDSMERLKDDFYRHYNPEHWFFTIKTYDILLENLESFVQDFGDEELNDANIKQYELALQSELVATFYHTAEALFTLIVTLELQIPWLAMKRVRMSELSDFIDNELQDDELAEDVINYLFYPKMNPADGDEGVVEDSVEFIIEYLRRMGEIFQDNDVYREYKHGLRLSTSVSQIRITSEDSDTPGGFARGGEAHVYLNEEVIDNDGPDVYHQVEKITSGFDYELYLRLCIFNYRLIDHLINVHRQQRTKEESEPINASRFDEYDLDEVFDRDYGKSFSFSERYPIGETIYEISS